MKSNPKKTNQMALKRSGYSDNMIVDTTSGKKFTVYENKVTCNDGSTKYTSSTNQQAEFIRKKTQR
jgi:hypothetical protein